MVCLHTFAVSLCRGQPGNEGLLHGGGNFSYHLPVSLHLSHFHGLFFYANVVGKRDAFLWRLLWSLFPAHLEVNDPVSTLSWLGLTLGYFRRVPAAKHPHSNTCCVCFPFQVDVGVVASAENQVLN